MDEAMCENSQEIGLRCVCGKLLLKRMPAGLELKCARCKRVVMLQRTEEEVYAASDPASSAQPGGKEGQADEVSRDGGKMAAARGARQAQLDRI